jgi:membrane-bound lytic murein transglycosylase D
MLAKRLFLALLFVGAALPLSAAEPKNPETILQNNSGDGTVLLESLGDGFRLLAGGSGSSLWPSGASASAGVWPGCEPAEGAEWFEGLLHQAHVWLSGGSCGEVRRTLLTLPDPSHPRPLALYDHPAVDEYLEFYLKYNGRAFERGLRRAGRYLGMIHRTFAEEGVPFELAYLPAVESNFNPRARSPARATGLWQFMAATAVRFGLKLRWPWYDERLDPEASTRAAARLLAYLYDRYGSWELALAAYNAGEGKINRAMVKARRRGAHANYWNLDLPLQTEAYVPAFLAMARLYGAPADFGFGHVEREAPEITETLYLEAPTSLAEIAHRLGMPLPDLVRLNPAWRRGYIPARYRKPVKLRLPTGMGEKLLASLASEEVALPPWLTHTVARRETLSEIAMIYGVRIADILAVNPIGDRNFLAVGQRLVIPLTPEARRAPQPGTLTLNQPVPSKDAPPPNAMLHFHHVQDGESLETISRRYGVSVTELSRWNPSLAHPLRPARKMVVYLPEPPRRHAAVALSPSS